MIEQERDVASGPGNRWNEGSASAESKEKAARDSIIYVHENRHQSLTRFEQMDQIVQSTHTIARPQDSVHRKAPEAIAGMDDQSKAWLDVGMPTANDRSRKRIAILLFLALDFLFMLTSGGRVRTLDEVSVDFQSESLVTRGSTAVPQAVAANFFYGKIDRYGQPRAPYGDGQAILMAPWHVAARMLRAVLPGIPAESKDLFIDVVVTSSSATFSALAAALAFCIFCGLGIDIRTAVLAALMLALGTSVFAYSAWFFSEPLAAALLLGAALTLFASGEQGSTALAAVAGVLLGMTVWVRPAHIIAVPMFFLALLLRDRKKSIVPALTLGAIVALFGGAYLLRNQIYFGNPMDFGYPVVAEGDKHLNSFETPLATGLYGFLLSPGKSIFLFAPLLLLAIPGVFKLAKRNIGLAIVAGGTPLIYLLFFARYTQWEGGYCVGPRYLVPAIALLCLGLGPVLAEATPSICKLAVVLFVAGALVQIVSIGTSFMEDQSTGKYYDEGWNYRMDYSSIKGQTGLLLHYLGSSKPARMNFGHDRWFVFLAKGGVSRGVLAAGIIFQVGGLVFFGWQLRNALAALGDSGPPRVGHLSADVLGDAKIGEPVRQLSQG